MRMGALVWETGKIWLRAVLRMRRQLTGDANGFLFPVDPHGTMASPCHMRKDEMQGASQLWLRAAIATLFFCFFRIGIRYM